MNNTTSHNNKGILIVGATSGLGLGVAEHFIAEGWRVGVAGRNNEALLRLSALNPEKVFSQQIDITSPDAPDKLSQLAEKMGPIDIYLHSAGVYREDPSLPCDLMHLTVNTNVEGFASSLIWAYHYFRNSGRKGRVVAISSVAGYRGLGDLPVYSASKAFDQAFIEALRQKSDTEKLPVDFVDIRPGWTRTPLLSPSRRYLFEMPAEKVLPIIIKAVVTARRNVTIGLRWKLLTFFERILPSFIWAKLHIPLWR